MKYLWEKYNGNKIETVNKTGVVYVIEYGSYIKIGSTKDINKRYRQLYKQATEYGNVIIGDCYYSPFHEKYKETELCLHKIFEKKRKLKTELFNISLEDFLILYMI